MQVSPDFVGWMKQQVGQWSDRYEVEPGRAFQAWALSYIFEVEDDDAFNQSHTLSRGDAGLDGWHYDRDEGVFHLTQAKYSENPLEVYLPPGDLDSLVKAALLLGKPGEIKAGPQHNNLAKVAFELQSAIDDGASVSLDFFLAGALSNESKANLTTAVAALGERFSANFYDLERLYELKLAEDPIEDLSGQQVIFSIAGTNEYFDRPNIPLPGVKRVAVFVLDGRSLADAVAKWGPKLFHGNVRYYLRRSNRVNKAMLETLDDVESRKAFWLYNNGITMVAESFEFRSSDKGPILTATNPQIVNGAQTSSVLHERRAKMEHGDVAVQARIIAVEPGDAGRTAHERISEYTNSQSPVRSGDLRSNDRRHRTIQTHFSMLNPPYFYERRRGEWQSMTPAQRAKYGKMRVTKEEVGQRFLAYNGRPADAITKRESIFGDLEKEAFNPTISAHEFMLAYELYEQASDLIRVSNEARLKRIAPVLMSHVTMKSATEAEVDSPTFIELIRPVHKLVCAHAIAMAREVLLWRYNSIAEARAIALRERLTDSEGETYRFIWSYVWKTVRLWLSTRSDKVGIKAALQRSETVGEMKAVLLEYLVDADKDRLPPIRG